MMNWIVIELNDNVVLCYQFVITNLPLYQCMNPFYSPPSNKSTSIKFCYASPPRQNTSIFSSSYLGKSYNTLKTVTNLGVSTRMQQRQDHNKKSLLVKGRRQQKQNLVLLNKTMAFQSVIVKVNTENNKPMTAIADIKKTPMQAHPLTQSIIFHPNHQHQNNQQQQHIMNQPHFKQTQSLQKFHFSKVKPQLRKIQGKASNAKIGEFVIGEMLGKGSIGRVFLVKHIGTNFYYALKIIKKSQVKDIEQLIFGIKIHCFLNHPNLTQIYACFNDQANIYLLMELCANGNLSKYRKKIKNDEERDRIVTGIAKGVSYMHDYCIRHGDLKLENILINHGFPKITDFDCIFKGSHKPFAEKRRKSNLWGSPAYFSPDMIKQNTFSLQDDIWSLGIIMYQIYCNSHPFNLKDTDDLSQIIEKQMNPISSEVKEAAKNLITKMLDKNRSTRARIQQIEKYGV